MDDFESDLKPILDHLRSAERDEILLKKTGAYRSAFNELDNLALDYPEQTDKIAHYKLPHIRQLLKYLSSKRPDIDFDSYINLVLVLLSNAKDETKNLIAQNPALREYLVSEFLPLWAPKSQPELRIAFECILESNTAK